MKYSPKNNRLCIYNMPTALLNPIRLYIFTKMFSKSMSYITQYYAANSVKVLYKFT